MPPHPVAHTLVFSHLDDMPPVLVEHVLADFRKTGAEVTAESRSNQPSASLEDYLPTAIVLFIFKPFLESFLKKAGEDSYAALKAAIKRCYEGARTIKYRLLVSGTEKAGRSSFCTTFSIYSKTEDGRTIKFLFSTSTTDQSLDEAIAKMLEVVRGGQAPGASGSRIQYITLLVYDAGRASWVPHHVI